MSLASETLETQRKLSLKDNIIYEIVYHTGVADYTIRGAFLSSGPTWGPEQGTFGFEQENGNVIILAPDEILSIRRP